MLKSAGQIDKFGPTIDIIRQIALTGCRRGEIINLKWCDVDLDGSCLRLSDSKEGKSVRPIGLPVVEFLEQQQSENSGTYVFSGPRGEDTAFGGRSEEHTSELQSLLRISFAVFCLKKKPT